MGINRTLSQELLGVEFDNVSNAQTDVSFVSENIMIHIMSLSDLTNTIKRGDKKGFGRSIARYKEFKEVGLEGTEKDLLNLENYVGWMSLADIFIKRNDKSGRYKASLCFFLASLSHKISPEKSNKCYIEIAKLFTKKPHITKACQEAVAVILPSTSIALNRLEVSPSPDEIKHSPISKEIHEEKEGKSEVELTSSPPLERVESPAPVIHLHHFTAKNAVFEYPAEYTNLMERLNDNNPVKQVSALFLDYADKAFDYRKFDHWMYAKFRFFHWNRHHEMPAREVVAALDGVDVNSAINIITQKIQELENAHVLKTNLKDSSFYRRAIFAIKKLEQYAQKLEQVQSPRAVGAGL